MFVPTCDKQKNRSFSQKNLTKSRNSRKMKSVLSISAFLREKAALLSDFWMLVFHFCAGDGNYSNGKRFQKENFIMKQITWTVTLLFITTLVVPTTLTIGFAQDYTRLGLPEGATMRLGRGSINEFQYAPDGKLLAVASSIGIWLYDTETYQEVALFTGHTGTVHSVSFSPDGKTLASGSSDTTICLWNIATGDTHKTLTGHTGAVHSVRFSPDGQTLASGGGWQDNTIRFWDVVTGEQRLIRRGHTDAVHSVRFSPDGWTLASGSYDNTLRLWDVTTGNTRKTLPENWPGNICFSPDGQLLASRKDTIRLLDVTTGEERKTLAGGSDYNGCFSPDGQLLASASDDGTLRLWDVATGEEQTTLRGHTDFVKNVSFSPDGQLLASASDDGTLRLWDVASGDTREILTGYTGSINSVSFSPDSRTLASGSNDSNRGWPNPAISLWDVSTGELHTMLYGHEAWYITGVSFSSDGRTLASGSGQYEYAIRLWDVSTGEERNILFGHTEDVSCLSFSPDGQTLASGDWDGTIRLWDVATGEERITLLHDQPGLARDTEVTSVSFSPDGRTLASAAVRWRNWGDGGGTIRLWDVATGEQRMELNGHQGAVSVSFSPDGQTLASGSRRARWGGTSDTTLRLWDVTTGEQRQTLTGHTDGVSNLSFSPDGQLLAGVSGDNTVRLWDATTGELRSILRGHTDRVTSVSFGPAGRTLASGSWDGTVLLWDIIPIANANAVVDIAPVSVTSPAVGKQITFNIRIADARNVTGYQATLLFDITALRYVESTNGDYLPAGTFFLPTVADGNRVTLAAASLDGESHGDGTLAIVTFEVIAVKSSNLMLSEVNLITQDGTRSSPRVESGQIIEPPEIILPQIKGDVNQDGIVNIQDLVLVASRFGQIGANDADINEDNIVDIVDLVLVAGALGNAAAAPTLRSQTLEGLVATDVQRWLTQGQETGPTDANYQRGILYLRQLLAALTPTETSLLPNYPNPFNPETWIPYQLAEAAYVTVRIYAASGPLIRTLKLGHQPIGIYLSRSRAAYWDGRNAAGEPVASGVYFYTLSAGDFTATKKMLVLK